MVWNNSGKREKDTTLNLKKVVKSVNKYYEKQSRSDKLSQKTEYQKYLEELEDPNYQGGSWALPENPIPLEQAKYEICQKVIRYKRNINKS